MHAGHLRRDPCRRAIAARRLVAVPYGSPDRHNSEPRAECAFCGLCPGHGRLPRAWIALLSGRVTGSLAATGGVEAAGDVARYLLAGADAVMTTSALLRNGPAYATVLLDGLVTWMARKVFASVDDLRGMLAVPADLDQAAFERAGYVTAMRAANAGALLAAARVDSTPSSV